MKRETIQNYLILIKEKVLTIPEILFYLESIQPSLRWSSRDQILASREEIRANWFNEHMVSRSIGINQPIWVNRPIKLRELISHRTDKLSKASKTPEMCSMISGVLKCIYHYRTTLDKSHTHIEQPLDRSEIKPSEIVAKRASLRQENEDRTFYRPINRAGRYATSKRVKAERRLSVAYAMATMENATSKAIERYNLMLLDQQSRYPGLPSHYLPRGL